MAEMSQNPERILTHLHHGILTHGVDESKSGDAGSEDARGCRVEFEIKAQVRAFRVDERVSKGRHGKDNLVISERCPRAHARRW